MSKRSSVTQFGDPTHPTKLVITGVPPGPEAQALIDKYTGDLRHFHRAQQQNLELSMEGGIAVHRGHTTFGDGTRASYSNIHGQETLRMEIAPEILARLPQPIPGDVCFDYALIEWTIEDMVDFESKWAVKIRSPLTVGPPGYDPKRSGVHGGMLFGCSSADASDANENVVEDRSRVLSLRIDLQPFRGQEMVIELYGRINPRHVFGGEGEDGGVCIASELYGRYGVPPVDMPTTLADCSTLDSPLLWITPDIEFAQERLVFTFPETDGLPSSDDQFIGIGYSLTAEWAPTGFADWTIVEGQVPFAERELADEFAALNPAEDHVTTYWDDAQEFVKTDTWNGTTIFYSYGDGAEASNDLDDVPEAIPATAAITFRNEIQYFIPTWAYVEPRSAEMKAVMVRPGNAWQQTSRHLFEEPSIDGDDDWRAESFVWETPGFPNRPNMRVIEGNVIIPVEEPQDDNEPDEDGILERDEDGNIIPEEDIDPTRFQGLPIIGLITIVPCANRIVFEQLEYTPPDDGNGGGEGEN